MNKANDVDQYIVDAPAEVQGKLKEIRAAIRDVASQAEEKISYGMPYYGYKGRLAYFAHAKHHIGLYIPPPIIENHKEELKIYVTSKSAVQFPLEKNLPIPLIQKLVKARIAWNSRHNSAPGDDK